MRALPARDLHCRSSRTNSHLCCPFELKLAMSALALVLAIQATSSVVLTSQDDYKILTTACKAFFQPARWQLNGWQTGNVIELRNAMEARWPFESALTSMIQSARIGQDKDLTMLEGFRSSAQRARTVAEPPISALETFSWDDSISVVNPTEPQWQEERSTIIDKDGIARTRRASVTIFTLSYSPAGHHAVLILKFPIRRHTGYLHFLLTKGSETWRVVSVQRMWPST